MKKAMMMVLAIALLAMAFPAPAFADVIRFEPFDPATAFVESSWDGWLEGGAIAAAAVASWIAGFVGVASRLGRRKDSGDDDKD